jgi:hypothetical protein
MGSVDPRQDDLDPVDPQAHALPGPWDPARWDPALGDPALTGLVWATSIRMQERLAAAVSANALTRDEVIETERAIRQLLRAGRAPSVDRFWTATALPRADRLCCAARAVIDDELSRLTGEALALALDGPVDTDRAVPAATAVTAADAAAVMSRRLETALPANSDIDALGRWWLRRLRWAARLHALPQLLRTAPPAAGLVLANRELQLLDQPPWSHSDRLLSAFELARADIRRYGRRRIAETADQLVAPVRPHLTILPV